MSYKKGVVATVAVVACSALFGVGSASATVLCKSAPANHVCPNADGYGEGTHISATAERMQFVDSSNTVVMECTGGTFSATVAASGAQPGLELKESAYSLFSGCTHLFEAGKAGTTILSWVSGSHNGSGEQFGAQVKWNWGAGFCTYEIEPQISLKGGASPSLQYSSVPLRRIAGAGCPGELKMSTTFSVNTPTPLYVEESLAPPPASVLCSSNPESHICPSENIYGIGTTLAAKAVSAITFVTNSGLTLVTCEGGTVSGAVAAAGGEASMAELSETKQAYSGCSKTVTPITTGSMSIAWVSGTANGTLTQSGGETQLNYSGTTCTYRITGGQLEGGAAPKLVYNKTIATKTAGSGLCISQLNVSGEYAVESPTPLFVQS